MDVFFHPNHRLHDPKELHRFGGELLPPAEVAQRADRIVRALQSTSGFTIRLPEAVDRPLLEAVHSARYLRFLEHAHERWLAVTGSPPDEEAVAYIRPIPGTPWKVPTSVLAQMGQFSNDVDPILAGTWDAATAAASSAASATSEAVRSGGAYALTRPPGHHSGREIYGGYCYLNNAAIAATRFRQEFDRVAVLDIDTHHGNGTQSIFWDDASVLTVSIHGDPEVHFPFFTGYADETGGRDAEGCNINLPLPTMAGRPAYQSAMTSALDAVLGFHAEAVVVALGVDTHESHGVLALQDNDYAWIGREVGSMNLPTVFVQEGGYEPGTLEHAVPAVLSAFESVR